MCMILCYGTFATTLYLCCKKGITQSYLVGKMAQIIDPQSSYNSPSPWNDKTYANKVLKCTTNYSLSNLEDALQIPVENVIQEFEQQIVPLMDEDKKSIFILALLNIIFQDETIDFNRKDTFTKYIGLDKESLFQQPSFPLADLTARTFLYTVLGDVDNRIGKTYISCITNTYLNDITKDYKYEYTWDFDSQKLYLLFNEFEQALEHTYKVEPMYPNNNVRYFIEHTDPAVRAYSFQIDNCEKFCEDMRDILSKFTQDSKEIEVLYCKISEFIDALDKYTSYLGYEMHLSFYAKSKKEIETALTAKIQHLTPCASENASVLDDMNSDSSPEATYFKELQEALEENDSTKVSRLQFELLLPNSIHTSAFNNFRTETLRQRETLCKIYGMIALHRPFNKIRSYLKNPNATL